MHIHSSQFVGANFHEYTATAFRTHAAHCLTIRNDISEKEKCFLLLLKDGIDVNYLDGHFLKFWCDQADFEVVEALLQRGVNIEKAEAKNGSLLTWPINRGNLNLVRCLIEYNVSVTNESLVSAIKFSTPDIISFIMNIFREKSMCMTEKFEGKTLFEHMEERIKNEKCLATKVRILPMKHALSGKMCSELNGFLDSTNLPEYNWCLVP